jgi:hypothetical protein
LARAGVVERVQALLAPPPPTAPLLELGFAAAVLAVATLLATSFFDVHHWFTALFGYCH